jgi:hypothetical protein
VHPDVSHVTEGEIRNWSAEDVARWLRTAGYDEKKVIQRFIGNDISGSVLLDLQATDVGELSIHSFLQVMSSIEHLKATMQRGTAPDAMSRFHSETTSSNGRSSPEHFAPAHFVPEQVAPAQTASEHLAPGRSSPKKPSYTMSVSPTGEVLPSRAYGQGGGQIPPEEPADSVSIIGIEQEPPKPHRCSKGKNCSKYRRYQKDMERYQRDLDNMERLDKKYPNAVLQKGVILIGSPGNPETAQNLLRPMSEAEASVVASSAVFGPQTGMGPRLSEAALSEVQRLDPQETIRNFLRNQHLDDSPKPGPLGLETHNLAPADGYDHDDTSPPNAQPNSMAAHLRSLPKLTIPTSPNTEDMTTAVTTNRYFTPTYQNGSPTAVQQFGPFSHTHHTQAIETYRQGTPFSEMDVPITAIPSDPIGRGVSQSVPPSMQYRALFPPHNDANSFARSASVNSFARSTSTNSVARSTSTRSRDVLPLRPVNENKALTPIEGPADLIRSPRMVQHGQSGSLSSLASDPDVTHAGYMKKRKTTRLLRHEWSDAHFTLRGTNLAMHKDEHEAHRISRALDNIDVDEYAVACSSLATSSKLTAAFKRSILRSGNNVADSRDGTAFAFSLIPATKESEKKALFSNNGVKSHHFAVKSREQRIDWMRELMLAKALKKGRDSGDDILVNGNMI